MTARCTFVPASRTARGARQRMLCALLPVVVACRAAPPDPEPPVAPRPTASPVDEPPEPPPPAVDCGEAIEGADRLLRPGGLVMLGEMHGTRQIPAFTADLVCLGATRGLPVRLGVELPLGEQAAIDAYLSAPPAPATSDAPPAPADRDALLRSNLWTRPDQDGRSSEAMLALIERVRTLRQAGLDVMLFSFDVENRGDWNARDARMAELILERASAEPQALVITLSGNVHNRVTPGLPWNADAIPMGVVVHRARSDALSLDARYQEGTAWVCRSGTECGVARLSGSSDSAERRVVVQAEPDANGYHGTFSVGAIEAAPPAVASSPS